MTRLSFLTGILDFYEVRDDGVTVASAGTSLQTDSRASTSSLNVLQTVCPSCRPTNSIKAQKAN